MSIRELLLKGIQEADDKLLKRLYEIWQVLATLPPMLTIKIR